MASNYPVLDDKDNQSLVSNAYQIVKNNNPLLPTSMPSYSGLANLQPREALMSALTSPNQPSLAMSQFHQLMDQSLNQRAAAQQGINPLAQRQAVLGGAGQVGNIMGQTTGALNQEQAQRQQELASMLGNETQAGLQRVQAINANKQAQQQMFLNLLGGAAQTGGMMYALA